MATKLKTKVRKHRPHFKINSSFISKANKASHHVKKDVDRYLAKKPYQSMGVVMLAGVCLGYLIHRH